jgi:ring-1,2-phenylacetyl-CoA epoxidase subunit PaaC
VSENLKEQGLLYEVFVQLEAGKPHEHAGSVRAADPEMALLNARDVYARREHPVSLWVVPAESITATTSADTGPFFDPADDKALRLGDDQLVLGHRLSELCGHGPILETDIALTNVALDCVGQAQALLALAGEVEGEGRSADDLAYFRDEREFRNCLLVEQRQFLFDVYSYSLFEKLAGCGFDRLAAIAGKALKETRYHVRHSADWMIRLGDGTDDSRLRVQNAVDELWSFWPELYEVDGTSGMLASAGLAPDHAALERPARALVDEVFENARLSVPETSYRATGGRSGKHTEHLGHMLSEMQILARSFPGAEW